MAVAADTIHPSRPVGARRVLLLGATGTIGRATLRFLARRGYEVVCFVRKSPRISDNFPGSVGLDDGVPVTVRFGDVLSPQSLKRDGFCGERFDALVSCMASRSGAPEDAWAVDHRAHLYALEAAHEAEIAHMVLLSAICVQKPKLAFQQAKLAFEKALMESGLRYSIVRPTAFFKSLSGQLERVKRGKPFLVFGDGTLTACKPISDDDLAEYLCDCLVNANRWNRILPIGGPGAAMTPRQQGEVLFAALGKPPRFKRVPVRLLDVIIVMLGLIGHAIPAAAKKAELARIGRYYATESMLVFDHESGRYDAEATLSTGSDTLADFYARLADGDAAPDRGDHAVF